MLTDTSSTRHLTTGLLLRLSDISETPKGDLLGENEGGPEMNEGKGCYSKVIYSLSQLAEELKVHPVREQEPPSKCKYLRPQEAHT